MDLAVEKREIFGKANKALRKQGFIPAELYGHGLQNAHLAVKAKDFEKIFKQAGENTIINLLLGNKKTPVLVHDIQRDFLTDETGHIDFYEVRMDEKINVHIPIEFLGDPPAVKEKGGILNKVTSEIEVEVLPGDMPHSFKVDLSVLDDLNKSVYVRDIVVGKGVKVLLDPEMVVATITAPVEEKVEVVVDVAEVKVETEEKKAERAAGKAEEGTEKEK